jgi:hypothetical protein
MIGTLPSRPRREATRSEYGRRIADISRPEFVAEHVLPWLPEHAQTGIRPEEVAVATLQNDGTGPATVRYTIRGSTRLFAKLYTDDSGARVFGVLLSLWHDGFGAGGPYQVPEPLCVLERHNGLLMREATGQDLAAVLARDPQAGTRGVVAAARWLLALHGAPTRTGTAEQPWYMFLKLSERLAKAAAAHPREVKRLLDFLGRIEELADRRRPVERVQGHGQFRPIHVFLGDPSVTVIDLDRSGPGDPARDLAEFVHRLRSALGRDGGARSVADALTATFLREYAARAPRRLGNLPLYHGFNVLVSLCRHLKQLTPDDPARETVLDVYTREFEAATGGGLIGSERLVTT